MLSQETKTKILELYEEHSAASLEEIDALVCAVPLPELKQWLETETINKEKALKALLDSMTRQQESAKRAGVVFEEILLLFKDQTVLTERESDSLVQYTLAKMNFFPVASLIEGCKLILKCVQDKVVVNGKMFQFLPKILQLLNLCDKNKALSDGIDVTAYVDFVTNCLCSTQWDTSIIIPMISIFKELELSNNQMGLLIKKVLLQMNHMKISELPVLLYQLLKIGKKGNHKVMIVTEFIKFFDAKEYQFCVMRNQTTSEQTSEETEYSDAAYRSLISAEGVAMFHLLNNCNQDKTFGMEYLKNIKKEPLTFMKVAFLLSICNIYAYETIVFDILKQYYSETEKLTRLAHMFQEVNDLRSNKMDLDEVFVEIAKRCACGWDHIAEGLVLICLRMIDNIGSTKNTVTSSESWKFVSKVFFQLYESYEPVRSELIKILLVRSITSNTQQQLSKQASIEYFKIIAQIKDFELKKTEKDQKLSDFFVKNVVLNLRHYLDYLLYISFDLSKKLLDLLLCVILGSEELRNSFIINMKKGLYNRDFDNQRRTAIYALTESVVFTMNSLNATGEEISEEDFQELDSFFEDLLMSLKRLFGSQTASNYNVKELLYNQLYKIAVLDTRGKLRAEIYELIKNYFLSNYYEKSNPKMPLILRKVFSFQTVQGPHYVYSSILNEPLDMLLKISFGLMDSVGDGESEELMVVLEYLINESKADDFNVFVDNNATGDKPAEGVVPKKLQAINELYKRVLLGIILLLGESQDERENVNKLVDKVVLSNWSPYAYDSSEFETMLSLMKDYYDSSDFKRMRAICHLVVANEEVFMLDAYEEFLNSLVIVMTTSFQTSRNESLIESLLELKLFLIRNGKLKLNTQTDFDEIAHSAYGAPADSPLVPHYAVYLSEILKLLSDKESSFKFEHIDAEVIIKFAVEKLHSKSVSNTTLKNLLAEVLAAEAKVGHGAFLSFFGQDILFPYLKQEFGINNQQDDDNAQGTELDSPLLNNKASLSSILNILLKLCGEFTDNLSSLFTQACSSDELGSLASKKKALENLGKVVDIFDDFSVLMLSAQAGGDALLSAATKLYRLSGLPVLKQINKIVTTASEDGEDEMEVLAEHISKLSKLAQSIYQFIALYQTSNSTKENEAKPDKLKKKKKVRTVSATQGSISGTSLVPNLIFVLEQYEKTLLGLDKRISSVKSSSGAAYLFTVNLLKNYKRASNRDFRIMEDKLEEAFANESSDCDSVDESVMIEDDTEDTEISKKPKLLF